MEFHTSKWMSAENRVVVDVANGLTLSSVIVDLKEASLQTRNFHYLLASYVGERERERERVVMKRGVLIARRSVIILPILS
jgi:hypothetical protein